MCYSFHVPEKPISTHSTLETRMPGYCKNTRGQIVGVSPLALGSWYSTGNLLSNDFRVSALLIITQRKRMQKGRRPGAKTSKPLGSFPVTSGIGYQTWNYIAVDFRIQGNSAYCGRVSKNGPLASISRRRAPSELPMSIQLGDPVHCPSSRSTRAAQAGTCRPTWRGARDATTTWHRLKTGFQTACVQFKVSSGHPFEFVTLSETVR